MNTIGAFDSKPVLLLDTDVATSATVRSSVFHNAPGTPSCSVELVVTPLGATPVNLTVKWLGQDSAPASETATLYPLNVVVPDTSAIAAAYTVVFVLPIYTLYSQLQVTVASGGNVHVTAYVQGCSTEFTDTPQTSSGAASHVVVDSGTVTANLGTVAGLALDATMTGGTQQSKITDGTRVVTVKAASTAAVAADLALVVAVSPNNTPVLPTGAATAAKQPALGTAGAASTDVITVQGNASGTPVPTSETLPTAGAAGQFTVTTGNIAVNLGNGSAGTSFVCKKGVDLTCDIDSPGFLCVDWSTGDKTATGRKLYQGASMFIPISDVNKIWVGSSAPLSKGSWSAT